MANYPSAPMLPPDRSKKMSRKAAKVSAIIIAVFGLIFLCIGLVVFNASSAGKNAAVELQNNGKTGTVTDARVQIREDNSDGVSRLPTARLMELTFSTSDGGSKTLATKNFPKVNTSIYTKDDWYPDFDTKSQIVGQQVRYSDSGAPVVELDSQLPALVNAGWGFGNIFGLVFGGIGVLIIGGAAIFFFRGGN